MEESQEINCIIYQIDPALGTSKKLGRVTYSRVYILRFRLTYYSKSSKEVLILLLVNISCGGEVTM